MYDLPYYKEKNEQTIKEFIDSHPFAIVTGCDADNKPVVTQLPLFIEMKNGKQFLRGHIMKNTDHHKAFLQNDNVLVVFTGAHTYVSATWYSNPNIASTWNYMSVHARGIIRCLDDNALEEVLKKTSLHFENNNSQSPTVFDNLPPAFRQRVMHAIIAIEIEVTSMDNVFKLSQDRDLQSYLNIIKMLKTRGGHGQEIALEMEKRTKEVFHNYEE